MSATDTHEHQLSITGSFGDEVQRRRDRIDELRERAHNLAVAWHEVFGRHDTPVPVDDAWHHTEVALRTIQRPVADDHLDLAADHLGEAEHMLDQERDG